MPSQKAYAAVRRTEGREWIEIGSIGLLPEEVQVSVRKTKALIPYWDKENPVVRIAEVSLQESEVQDAGISPH